jgi:hypothetical protein
MSTAIPKNRGGKRRGAGRPPTQDPVYLVRLGPNLATAVHEGEVTLFLIEQLPGGSPRLRTLSAKPLRVLPCDLLKAVAAAEVKDEAIE